jgi:hypothetical protein
MQWELTASLSKPPFDAEEHLHIGAPAGVHAQAEKGVSCPPASRSAPLSKDDVRRHYSETGFSLLREWCGADERHSGDAMNPMDLLMRRLLNVAAIAPQRSFHDAMFPLLQYPGNAKWGGVPMSSVDEARAFAELVTLTGCPEAKWRDLLSLPQAAQEIVLQDYRDCSWVTPGDSMQAVLAVLQVLGQVVGFATGAATLGAAIRAL